MKRPLLVTAISAACVGGLAVSSNAWSDDDRKPTFFFFPIDSSASSADWTAAAPWKIPFGYEQELVSGEAALNIYDAGRDDWHDMNTVNETGPKAGRYMYRTHEVRGEPEGGSVSVVGLKTGVTKVIAQDTATSRRGTCTCSR